MSEQDAGTEQHEQGYEIVVNGAPPVPVQETVTYDEVVDIAYPGGRSIRTQSSGRTTRMPPVSLTRGR